MVPHIEALYERKARLHNRILRLKKTRSRVLLGPESVFGVAALLVLGVLLGWAPDWVACLIMALMFAARSGEVRKDLLQVWHITNLIRATQLKYRIASRRTSNWRARADEMDRVQEVHHGSGGLQIISG